MKGVIFTEFVEMVEESFGYLLADKLLNHPDLKSKGVYTAVGTYDFEEMLILLRGLSIETKTSISELLKVFGHHLFFRFYHLYPHFFKDKMTCFDFLSNIEDYIHVEVLKLYPDAQLPKIDSKLDESKKQMVMIYSSDRKLSDLALGLINGCIDHFNENIIVSVEKLVEDGSEVKIVLDKK